MYIFSEATIRFLKAKLRVMQEEVDRLSQECNKKVRFSGADPGISNWRGGLLMCTVEFLGSWDCLAPSHIPYVLVVGLENKTYIVNIAC